MAHPVFISYARKASRAHAEALWRALGGEGRDAFLDTSGVEPGAQFQRELVDALLGSRVVVLFASQDYFRRWYCLWELEAVLAPYLALEPGAGQARRDAALFPIVVVLPEHGVELPELSALPPTVRAGHWLRADETEAVAELVRQRLAQVPTSLQERLEASGLPQAVLRTSLLEENALPPPENLASLPVSPRALPRSLGTSFVGRADDLWRIHHTLVVLRDLRGEGAGGAALTGSLQGVGGFGKTRIALEYFHRFGPRHYPGGLFWVNADVSPERLEEQFHGVLRTLRPDVPALELFREQRRDAAGEMTGALEETAATKRVLFVVDNVPEPGPGERPRPLETWCPAIGKVSLLVTSRAKLELGTEKVHALHVAPLSPEPSVALLTEGYGGSAALRPEAWRHIAGWVGYMPLALELLNRTLRAGLSAPELLSHAEHQRPVQTVDAQMALLEERVPAGSLRGVTEALSLSYARLSPEEQRAARLVARFASEPIPLRLLEALGAEGVSPSARMSLHTRHFVTPVEATGDVALFGVMHRVLADFLRGQSPEEEGAALGQVGRALVSLMTVTACRDPMLWPLLSAALPHAEEVFEGGARLLERSPERTQETRIVLSVGLSQATFLAARGLMGPARSVGERVVELASRLLGSEAPETFTAMGNLALTSLEMGELKEARALQERVLQGQLRLLGEDHPVTLTARNNLSMTLLEQGDLEGARVQQERAVEGGRRLLGEDSPDMLLPQGNLAETLRSLGELKAARVLQERVLEGSRRMRGEGHPATLVAMGNLALTLRAQGELEGARVLQEQALGGSRRVLGEDHPDTFKAMNNLAITRLDQGRLDEARALQEQVLERRRRVSGDAHPATFTAMNNLAQTLFVQGHLEGARALQAQVLMGYRGVLGEHHATTLTAMGNLGVTIWTQGDLAGARVLQEQVVEGSRRVLGEDHPDTLKALGNLALTLGAQGDAEGSRVLQGQVVEGSLRVLGEDHPDTLRALLNLAETSREQGDLEGARVLQERVVEASGRVLGAEHPSTLAAMNNLAMTLLAQGALEDACARQARVVETSARVLGAEHPDTLRARLNLAAMSWKRGDPAGARAQEEQVVEASRRVLGAEHPLSLRAQSNLAETLSVQGDVEGARVLHAQVLEAQRRVLGEAHPDTLATTRALGVRSHAPEREPPRPRSSSGWGALGLASGLALLLFWGLVALRVGRSPDNHLGVSVLCALPLALLAVLAGGRHWAARRRRAGALLLGLGLLSGVGIVLLAWLERGMPERPF